MKKQKLKLNAKLSFDKDIVSTLNKDGLSQIVGGMMRSTATCPDLCVQNTAACSGQCSLMISECSIVPSIILCS